MARNRILMLEGAAFLIIIAISWLDEVLGVPELIFGDRGVTRLTEAGIETAAVIVVAVPVLFVTHQLLKRMYELESYLRLCAWCKKVHGEGGWMPFEEFLSTHTDTEFTHGMCEQCAENMLNLQGKKLPTQTSKDRTK